MDGFEQNLEGCLKSAGVKQDVVEKLLEDELNTYEILDGTSDELFKACGIKGGQIYLIRKGLRSFHEKKLEENLEIQSITSESSVVSSLPSTLSASRSPSPLFSGQENIEVQLTPLLSSTPLSKQSADLKSPSPSSSSGQDSPLQAFDSSLNEGGKWLQTFVLPSKFSPSVQKELDKKSLSPNRRNELTRDIRSSIRTHTMFPSKGEREHVALMIVRKYPFLADKLGTGIGSWQEAIKNRFKNLRKLKTASSASSGQPMNYVPQRKKAKKGLSDEFQDVPEGETRETYEDHLRNIKKEMAKSSNRNFALVKELMDITYPFRRNDILTEPASIPSIIKLHPALQLPSEFKNEFSRILKTKNLTRKMDEKLAAIIPGVLILAQETPSGSYKTILQEMKDGIIDEPDKTSEIEGAATVLILVQMLKEKTNKQEPIKLCSDDESLDEQVEKTSAPRLIGAGDLYKITPLYIAVEGSIVVKLNTGLASALSLLIGCFYIFNVEYPTRQNNFCYFLEAVLLDNYKEAKRRVSVNKLLQQLSF